jgi:hypothetical protein
MSETKPGQGGPKKPYEKPTVETFPSARILENLGPAMAGYSAPYDDTIGI